MVFIILVGVIVGVNVVGSFVRVVIVIIMVCEDFV